MKTRKEAKPMRATILRLEAETHKTLRIAAIEEGISMNDAINQAVMLWLKEQKKTRKGMKK
jgi:predicted HicB family RNase H-like nuclease